MTATPAGMTYADYLKLDTLLSAQQPISDLHDELLFVIIHQAKELWLKQMLHEVGFACQLVREDKFAEAYKALSRVSRIWTVMTLSWDVLATLTPVDYTAFRGVLGTSMIPTTLVIPAKAGTQSALASCVTLWIPAFAGMTKGVCRGDFRGIAA